MPAICGTAPAAAPCKLVSGHTDPRRTAVVSWATRISSFTPCSASSLASVDQFLHGNAPVSPPHLGDNAVGTVLVAALPRSSDTHNGRRWSGIRLARLHPAHPVRDPQHAAPLPPSASSTGFSDVVIGGGSQHRVHLGNLLKRSPPCTAGPGSLPRSAPCTLPVFRYSAISRMVLMLSSLASLIKQQVLTTITSASVSSSVKCNPAPAETSPASLGIHQILVTSQGNKQYFHTNTKLLYSLM